MSFPPEVEALIAAQAREIERLRAEVAELRRRLDLDSSTSSKPPSSDGLRKKPRSRAAFVGERARRAAASRVTRATRSSGWRTPTGSYCTRPRLPALPGGADGFDAHGRRGARCSTCPSG